jgi:hypothetical protein
VFHSMLVWFFRACTLKKVACICQECYEFTLKPQIIKMDVCLPVCKVPPTPSCASCSSCLEERAGSAAGALSQAGACQHGTQQHLLPAVARATAACFCDMCG